MEKKEEKFESRKVGERKEEKFESKKEKDTG